MSVDSLHISLMAGRIMLKDFRYHTSNQSIRCLKIFITWRYWLWRTQEHIEAEAHGETERESSLAVIITAANGSCGEQVSVQATSLAECASMLKASNGSCTTGCRCTMTCSRNFLDSQTVNQPRINRGSHESLPAQTLETLLVSQPTPPPHCVSLDLYAFNSCHNTLQITTMLPPSPGAAL